MLYAPVLRNENAGTVKVFIDGKIRQQIPLICTEPVRLDKE